MPTKFSQMPTGTTPDGTELIPLVQDGLNVTVPVSNLLAASSGASLVNWIQSGTGAVARTSQAKLRERVSVKDYGAVGGGLVNDSSAIQACIDANPGREIWFPKDDYLCNIVIDSHVGTRLVGETQGNDAANGVRLIAASSSSPVVSFGGSGNVIACQMENFLLDSLFDKTFSHAGTGLYIKAYSPNVAWRCVFKNLMIRGFDYGLHQDCDVNASEIYDCEFTNIEFVGCNTYSHKARGVYNTYKKIFATQVEKYGFYNDGSNSQFDTIITSGMQAYKGGGQHVTNAVIESIDSSSDWSALPAFEINGNTSTWRGLRLNGVTNAKHPLGFSVFGANQTIDNVVVQGSSPPGESIRLDSSSTGSLAVVSAPSTVTKIPVARSANWNFGNDVTDVVAVNTVYTQGSWTPALDRSTTSPTLTYLIQVGTYVRRGRLVVATGYINISAISAQGSGNWKVTGLPFAPSTSSNINFCGSIGQSDLIALTGCYTGSSSDAFLTNAGAVVTTNISTGKLKFTISYETDAS